MRRTLALCLFGLSFGLGVFGVSRPASADEVVLTNGQIIQGVVTVRGDTIEVRVDAGTIGFEKREVKEIRRGASPLEELAKRKSQVARTDVPGLRALAQWAEAQGLTSEARTVWRQVLDVAPDDATARERLGYQKVDGQWLTEDEAMRAKGFVRYGGTWKTPGEVAVLEEEAAARRARREEARSAMTTGAAQGGATSGGGEGQGDEAARGRGDCEGCEAEGSGPVIGAGLLGVPYAPVGPAPYGPYYRRARPFYLDPWSVYGGVMQQGGAASGGAQRPSKPAPSRGQGGVGAGQGQPPVRSSQPALTARPR